MSLSNYPTSIDSFYDPNNTTDTMASVPHNVQHGQVNDAVNAIETKLGTGSSTPASGYFLQGSGTGASAWVHYPTSPGFATSIVDSNGNTWLGITATGSAVNYVAVANAAAGSDPSIASAGSDSNPNLNLKSKGSGKVQDNGSSLIDHRSSFSNFIQSGGIWTIGSGLQASMSAMTLWIAGVEYSVAAISNHTFGASSDTYVDYTVGTGITYNAVSNNAASFALAANSVRVAIVVTSGAAVTSVNQGSTQATVPVASSVIYSVCDSLGNLIYPNNPNPGLIGYRQITGNFTSTNTTVSQLTGLTAPVTIPAGGHRIKIMIFGKTFYTATNNVAAEVTIWDGTVGSGTQIGGAISQTATATAAMPIIAMAIVTPASGSKTYNVGFRPVSAATATAEASATYPAFISVEIE